MSVLSLLLAAAAASASPAPAKSSAQDCSAHKFDTVVTAEVAGKPQSKRLRLCGQVGQSDGEWLATLEDSVLKLEARASIAKPLREAMVAALKVEIVRLKSAPAASTADPLAPAVAAAPPAPATTGEFTLKPRSVPPKGKSEMADFRGLPPLPDPVVVKAGEAAKFVPPPPIVRPDLAFQCLATGGIGEGPCDEIDRHGFVIARAKKAVGAGVRLHFVLDGEDRGDIDLSGMRAGQRLNLAIPGAVCRGTAGGRLELRVMVDTPGRKHPPQRAETIGPAILRCA